MTPILSVLTTAAENHLDARTQIKRFIFPCESQENEDKESKDAQRNVMEPESAPEGTVRHRIITLMTSADPGLLRYSGELLFTLCDSNRKL